MYQDERKLDFKPLGIAIKKAREAKGWTQEYLAQLVDLTPRSIMYIMAVLLHRLDSFSLRAYKLRTAPMMMFHSRSAA